MTHVRFICVLAAALAIGCGGDDSFTSPDPPPDDKPTCETNVTGRVTLTNGATSVETVALNGVYYGVINTGASMDLDLPPGQYSVQFSWGDGSAACMAAFITISVCSTQTLTCDG
jgi:hypothetical protein